MAIVFDVLRVVSISVMVAMFGLGVMAVDPMMPV
jgi:hypothetical protein